MIVYRITKSELRSRVLSGMGAFKLGGRWNSAGTYMLYTSMNSSLAYLETLVHFDEHNLPPGLFVAEIEITADDKLIWQLPDAEYSENWQQLDNFENKLMGDIWMLSKQYLAIKTRSAINPTEFNFLINPLFPGYHDMLKIRSVSLLNIDTRLIR